MNKQILTQTATVIPHPSWVVRQRSPQIAPHIEGCPRCGMEIHAKDIFEGTRFMTHHLVHACQPAGGAA